jgi:hypothetical protein
LTISTNNSDIAMLSSQHIIWCTNLHLPAHRHTKFFRHMSYLYCLLYYISHTL